MSKLKCPYYKQNDGNGDIIVNKTIAYIDNTECQVNVVKQYDICGKKYGIDRVFKLLYEQYIEEML